MIFFKRAAYIGRIFWSFRYYLLCTTAAYVFWNTPLILPFRLFVVMVHEIFHAATALLTGGQVLEMRTNLNESGHTLTQGGFFPLISAAGYVGSALLGALLIYTGTLPQIQRLLLLLIGAGCMGMTMWYTPVGGVDFYLGIFGGLILVAMAIKSQRAAVAAATWIGLMLCLYSLYDFYTDLWRHTELTDAGILARYWGEPLLAYPIALSWVLLSLAFMYRAMRALVRKKK
jgi:hypothetical protein